MSESDIPTYSSIARHGLTNRSHRNGFDPNTPQGHQHAQRYGQANPQTPPIPQLAAGFAGVNDLSQAMNGLSLHSGHLANAPGMNAPMSAGPPLGPGPAHGNNPAHYNYLPGGAYLFPFPGYPPYATVPRHGFFGPSGQQTHIPFPPNVTAFGPAGISAGYQYGPCTPQPTFSDVPGLEHRQSDSGSGDDRGRSSSPDTPNLGATNHAAQNAPVGPSNGSPRILYGYETPSPPQFGGPDERLTMPKDPLNHHSVSIYGAHDEPPLIPSPAMAGVFPPGSRKPLNLCLANSNNTKNVYIRGLHPQTSDETLLGYGTQFGTVQSAKAIIEMQTGDCKGFGFVLYAHREDAERCIREFYQRGYEASFARESFNHTLKSLQDPMSSNLYFSNLPKTMNESELDAILVNYDIESTRILRDESGASRGVGFARLKDRVQCDHVIKTYNGYPVGVEGLLLQVRYADTAPQRNLKKDTQQRRDHRSREHNMVVYGSPTPRFPSARNSRFATFPRTKGFQRAHVLTNNLSSSLGASSGERRIRMMERSGTTENGSPTSNEAHTENSLHGPDASSDGNIGTPPTVYTDAHSSSNSGNDNHD
ncbi:MAG: hypothetical protein M1837_007113 [Sclerophora amabilis]|nr:MAG: hypothetical protein M1837_007113 [Sclerophora amabilis]